MKVTELEPAGATCVETSVGGVVAGSYSTNVAPFTASLELLTACTVTEGARIG